MARNVQEERPLLPAALAEDKQTLEEALASEERAERERDRIYWQPLKEELEELHRAARRPL